MKYNKLIRFLMMILVFVSLIFSSKNRNVEPTISIRYNDIISGMTPTSSIGMLLGIDDEKYTGFDTNSDGDELRIIMGWKWSIMGIGTKDIDDETVSLFTFGAKYGILDNMFTAVEYVMVDHETINDAIRISVGVKF